MSLTTEEFVKILKSDNIEDYYLPDDIDLVKVWEEYEKEDDTAICGAGTKSIVDINTMNSRLAGTMGCQMYLPQWGRVLDLGAGYNAMKRFIPPGVEYYPCDIIKRTPETTVVTDCQLPFPDNHFNGSLTSNMFHHITPNMRMKYIQELTRVTSENGYIMVSAYMISEIFAQNNIRISEKTGKSYAYTGDYIVPIIDKDELNSWSGMQLLSTISITARNDNYCTVWFQKIRGNNGNS